MKIYQRWVAYGSWVGGPGIDTIYCPELLVGGPGWALGDSTMSPVSFISTFICSPAFSVLPDSFDMVFDPATPEPTWINSSVLTDWNEPAFLADSGAVRLRRRPDGLIEFRFGFRYHRDGVTPAVPALRVRGVMVISDSTGPGDAPRAFGPRR
ncbi:MAG TPA: hypothetical protein VFI13_13410 [Gemmatimonadales bacterium]|nr:hypothetical protein [Gemmatimonadales bacterium]